MSSIFFEHTLIPTKLLVPMHVKHTNHNCICNYLPEDEPSGSKYVEDIKIKNKNINLENVHCVGLCCTNYHYRLNNSPDEGSYRMIVVCIRVEIQEW